MSFAIMRELVKDILAPVTAVMPDTTTPNLIEHSNGVPIISAIAFPRVIHMTITTGILRVRQTEVSTFRIKFTDSWDRAGFSGCDKSSKH
jgi:hypothetical protein